MTACGNRCLQMGNRAGRSELVAPVFNRRANCSRRAVLSLLAVWFICPGLAASGVSRTLRCGWYLWDPYQFTEAQNDSTHLTGLDVELVRTIFEGAGYGVEYDQVDWGRHQADIMEGRRDIAAGAFKTGERDEYARFSEPYRTETDVLIMRSGEAAGIPANSVGEMLEQFRARRFRLGVVEGYFYGFEMNAWARDPANSGLVFKAQNDYINLSRLLDHEIDGFLVDRLAGATAVWRQGVLAMVEEHTTPVFTGGLRVMFSKKTTTVGDVEAFNASLRRLRDSGSYNGIVREYLFPVMLAITIHRPWFFFLEILGTFAFAISGVLVARKERYDIFGALLMSALPSVGGSILRDVICDRNPIAIMRTPVYLLIVVGVVLSGTLFYKVWDAAKAKLEAPQAPAGARKGVSRIPSSYARRVLESCDALGLAAFTVVGVVVAVETRCSPLLLWGPLLATITGAGGGIVSDTVRADSNNRNLKGSIYPEISLFWGLLFSLFLLWETPRLHLREVQAGVLVAMAGILLSRWAVLHFEVQSLFLYDHRRRAPAVGLARAEATQAGWLGCLTGLLGGVREESPREGSFDLDGCLNRCKEVEGEAEAQLDTMAGEKLPDADLKRHSGLRKRQALLSAMQADLYDFAARAEESRRLGRGRGLVDTLVEALDAVLHVGAAAARSRSGGDILVLLQATGDRGDALSRVRERCVASASSAPAGEGADLLRLVGAFERVVGHACALGRALEADARPDSNHR